MSISPTSPADIFGGTWEALNEGRVLIGANSEYPVGATGGEKEHVLSEAEMPSHTHTEESAGSHSHSGSALSEGSHTHSRGTMNITGYSDSFDSNSGWDSTMTTSGAFYTQSLGTRGKVTDDSSNNYNWVRFGFDASRAGAWTGATSSSGSHSHSLSVNSGGSHAHTINNAGSGEAHNNMQPYLAVYMWKRTA